MSIQILQKQLDSSTLCPLCKAAMYWVDATQFEHELNFHQCSYCEHRVFTDKAQNCHCDRCCNQRKKLLKETRLQEVRKYKQKNVEPIALEKLSFMQKLFILSILDDVVSESTQHNEFIQWQTIQYAPLSPTLNFQKYLFKQLEKEYVLVAQDIEQENSPYYLHTRLDGYAEPSLFSVAHQLRAWFYEDLTQGIPFKEASEVKACLYQLLYQEIVQFAQHTCKAWNIQISGHSSLQQLCFKLLDSLAVEQIFSLVHNALRYLHKNNALDPKNESFVNTHRLKKVLIQYRERAIAEKWETPNLPRPQSMRFHKMGEILYFKFLKYDERIFSQPIWHLWKKIEPRLNFYSDKRCMQCGSNDLEVEYDAKDYVSLICRTCKHRDHYFTR